MLKTKKGKFEYRYLKQEEYNDALVLCLAVFDEAVAVHNPPAGRDSFVRYITSDELKRAFQNGDMQMAGCFLNKVLIGVIGVKGLLLQPHISLLFVSQHNAKHGIGKKLINFVLGDKKGVTVNASINAERFYENCGFSRTAEMVFEDGLKTIPMQRKSSYSVAKAVALVLSAVIPLIIIAIALYWRQIFPFGPKSFLIYDLKSQYIDFYNAFSRLFSGELFYSFSRTLGGDNFTLAAYYLFSPFNLVLLLFNKTTMSDGVLLVFVLKVMSSGLTFAACAMKSRLITKRNSVFYFFLPVLATIYALCGFSASYSLNVFWLDAVILLPLLSLAIEKACKGKSKHYILVLAISLVINFYFGYMLLIFALTAFPVYKKYFWKSCTKNDYATFLKNTVIACMLSGVVTIPVFFGLMATKLSQSSPIYALFKNISFADTVSVLTLFLIIGAISFVLVNIFKLKSTEKISKTKTTKTWYTAAFVVLAIILISAEYDKLPSIFHQLFAFYNDVETPPIFITFNVVVLFIILPFTNGVSNNQRLLYFVLPVFWLLTLLFEPLYLIIHMGQHPLSFPGRQAFILSFLILQDILTLLDKLTYELKKHKLKPLFVILPFLMVCEVITNTANTLKVNEKAYYGFTAREDYVNFIEQTGVAIDRLNDEQEFFRIEKTYNRSLNDAYTFGTSGISHYSSMYENEVINTFNLMGLSASAYWAKYNGSTPVTDMLFGVRYVLDNDQIKSYQKDFYIKEFSVDGITAYRNPYALPVIMTATDDLKQLKANTINPFELQNRYIKAITGSDILPFEEIKEYEKEENIYHLDDGSPDIKVLEYNFKASENSGLFLSLKYVTKPLKVFVYGVLVCEYPTADNSGTLYLGKIEAGDNVFVTIEADVGTTIPKDNIFIAALNPDKLKQIFDAYNNGIEITKVSPGFIEAKSNSGATFVSVPYSIGWRAFADGKIVETYNAGSGFLGVNIPKTSAGNIKLIYTPPGIWTGLLITCFGVFMFYVDCWKRKGR